MRSLASLFVLIVPASSWTLADRFAGWVPFPRPRRRQPPPPTLSSASSATAVMTTASVRRAGSSSSGSESGGNINSSGGNQNVATMSTKQHYREMVNFLDRPMESTVGDVDASSYSQQRQQEPLGGGLEDVQDLVRTIVRAADSRKAEQIVALQVHRITTLTSYLVILSGSSRPQNSAIAASIASDVADQFGMRPVGNGVPEGSAESGWMVVDYGSVMVHIMTPKSRLFYNVEGQWRQKGAIEMDVSDCIVPNTATPPLPLTGEFSEESQKTRVEPQEEDDPFWS